jgi:Domain of unknown function (DUF4403)
MKTLRNAASILICAAFLTGCFTKVNPPDPVGSPGPLSVSSNVSYLTLPVEFKLADVAAVVNRSAPGYVQGTYNITHNVPHIHFHGAFQKPTVTQDPVIIAHIDYHADRGEIELGGANDKISVQASLSGSGKLIPSAASADLSGTVNGSSTLTINSDYNLAPSVNLTVTIQHATILGGISVIGLVQGAVNDAINKNEGGIAAEIGKAVNLRNYAETGWNRIPGCIAVPGATDIWIRFSPQSVLLAGPQAANNAVTATLALEAKVETLYQASEPSPTQRGPLPNLAGAAADQTFHLALPVEINVNDLNSTLSSLLKNKSLATVPLGKDENVTLNTVSVSPRGNQLFLKVGFEGNRGFWLGGVNGTLIFGARPVLDASTQKLSFKNIDFTADTKSTFKGAAYESAAWVLNPIFLQLLESTCRSTCPHSSKKLFRTQIKSLHR